MVLSVGVVGMMSITQPADRRLAIVEIRSSQGCSLAILA